MEEVRVKGIVLSSSDHKEKDKQILIFSIELGKINGILRGVKSPKAKLKFASQPFCFASFEMVKQGEYYLVTQVDLIDSFYELTADYEKFQKGSSMLKVCSKVLRKGIVNPNLFITLINSLKILTYENLNEYLVVCKFILEFLKNIGYGLNLSNCIFCGKNIDNEAYFNNKTGDIYCETCKNIEYIELKKEEFIALKQLNAIDFDELESLKFNDEIIIKIFNILNYELKRILNQ